MNNMKKIRLELGVSQALIAEMTSVTQGSIGHYESGRRLPSLSVSQKIVKALNDLGAKCSFDDVFPSNQ